MPFALSFFTALVCVLRWTKIAQLLNGRTNEAIQYRWQWLVEQNPQRHMDMDMDMGEPYAHEQQRRQ